MRTETSEVEQAADYAVDFTESPESRLFFLKAGLRLTAGQVIEACHEIKMREHSHRFPVKDRAKYVIWTLKEWMKEAGVDDEGGVSRPCAQEGSRPLSQRPLEAFRSLPVPANLRPTERTMDIPYSRKWLPWFREIGNEMFTLTNETADWDVVNTQVDMNGDLVPVELFRGKLAPDDRKPQGILTVGDIRTLIAAVKSWSDASRGKYDDFQTGAKTITHIVEAQQLCEYLGISTGGKQIADVTNSLLKHKRTGYYYRFLKPGLEGFSFQFISNVEILDKRENRLRRRHLRITFSEPYSRQLIDRNVVSRPLSMLQIRGDLAFKLAVEIFPVLKKRGEFASELNPLIDKIGLKRTGWSAMNGYKSLRLREFEKPVKELNGLNCGDGRVLCVWIAQQINPKDFCLEARFVKNDAVSIGE